MWVPACTHIQNGTLTRSGWASASGQGNNLHELALLLRWLLHEEEDPEMAGAPATTIAAMSSTRWAPLRMADALGH